MDAAGLLTRVACAGVTQPAADTNMQANAMSVRRIETDRIPLANGWSSASAGSILAAERMKSMTSTGVREIGDLTKPTSVIARRIEESRHEGAERPSASVERADHPAHR